MKKKYYIVTEVITQTVATEYLVEAGSPKEALREFRTNGQYLGDYITDGSDRTEIKLSPESVSKDAKQALNQVR